MTHNTASLVSLNFLKVLDVILLPNAVGHFGLEAKEDAGWCLNCVLQQLTDKPTKAHIRAHVIHSEAQCPLYLQSQYLYLWW